MNLRYVQKESANDDEYFNRMLESSQYETLKFLYTLIKGHSKLLARELQFHDYDVASGNVSHGDLLFHPVETVGEKKECEYLHKHGYQEKDSGYQKYKYCPECGEKLG